MVFVFGFGFLNAQNPIIQNILNDIKIDSLMDYAEKISGETGVIVNGELDTIYSRHKTRPGNELAFKYIIQEFERHGLQSDSLIFSATGKNALAIQPGSVYPDKYFILCAHYDDMPNLPIAPAADDDGSGTAAVLEAARVLSQYDFEYTIIYAIWDEEEQGLVGSNAYADLAQANGDSLMGVINMDAIAWDGDNDSAAMIHTRPIGSSLVLSDTIQSVNATYNLNLDLTIQNPGATYSDHASFWNSNFGAVLVIEDWTFDPNPHYHTDQDLVAYFNIPYFEKLSKLSLASLATLAIPVGFAGEDEIEFTNDVKIFPNPANEKIHIQFPEIVSGSLEIYSMNGEKVYSEQLNNMYYQEINLGTFSNGLYILSILTETGNIQKRFIKF